MKINFAQVSHEDVDTFGDDGLFGPNEDGEFFYNTVEFGTNAGGLDEVAIHDTAGRYMPITVEHIPGLIAALHEVYALAAELKQAERVTQFATSHSTGHVTDSTLRVKYNSEDLINALSKGV